MSFMTVTLAAPSDIGSLSPCWTHTDRTVCAINHESSRLRMFQAENLGLIDAFDTSGFPKDGESSLR
jgi:hypothetical protein